MRRAPPPGPPPPRPRAAHKASVGRVLVVGGCRGMAGAPFLAGYGALRAGAGLVRVAVPAPLQDVVAGFAPELLTAGLAATPRGELAGAALAGVRRLAEECDAAVLGCGAGRAAPTRRLLLELARTLDVPLVLDADALFALAATRRPLARNPAPRVLTPHEGEAARLLGTSAAAVRADREDAARSLAERHAAVVVLKGPGTLVTDGARLWRCTHGGPVLASGGTGDVLAGVIAALLAQDPAQALLAAMRGVAWHARAGDLLARRHATDRGVLAGELAEALPLALRGWARGR